MNIYVMIVIKGITSQYENGKEDIYWLDMQETTSIVLFSLDKKVKGV